MASAASAAPLHALRGYDAVHCAAAGQLRDTDLVAGGRRLLAAWRTSGVAGYDIRTVSAAG